MFEEAEATGLLGRTSVNELQNGCPPGYIGAIHDGSSRGRAASSTRTASRWGPSDELGAVHTSTSSRRSIIDHVRILGDQVTTLVHRDMFVLQKLMRRHVSRIETAIGVEILAVTRTVPALESLGLDGFDGHSARFDNL